MFGAVRGILSSFACEESPQHCVDNLISIESICASDPDFCDGYDSLKMDVCRVNQGRYSYIEKACSAAADFLAGRPDPLQAFGLDDWMNLVNYGPMTAICRAKPEVCTEGEFDESKLCGIYPQRCNYGSELSLEAFICENPYSDECMGFREFVDELPFNVTERELFWLVKEGPEAMICEMEPSVCTADKEISEDAICDNKSYLCDDYGIADWACYYRDSEKWLEVPCAFNDTIHDLRWEIIDVVRATDIKEVEEILNGLVKVKDPKEREYFCKHEPELCRAVSTIGKKICNETDFYCPGGDFDLRGICW